MMYKKNIKNRNKYFFIIFFICFLINISCKKEKKSDILIEKNTKITYVKGFQIIENKASSKLIISNPYQNSAEIFEYTLSKNPTSKNEIQLPISRIVVTSTTHIPMIELLNEENSIVGFPSTYYISSEKTRQRVDGGFIKEIGKENLLNTEVILNLEPDLVVGYSVSTADKSLEIIKKSGIPVIYNGDWLEETPLGRAEWIQFFGLLFDKQQKADSIFKSIENAYLEAKKLAMKNPKKPTILSGAVMSKDIWNLPAGESFVAKFLADANLDYLWKDSQGKGSLSLSFESVFERAKEADFWIAPGYFSSKKEMLQHNKLYAEFAAFKNDNIYTPTLKKGKTGGVIYYELAPTRPDLVLKDLIKITNPDLLPNYKLTFFEKMN
ncbi:ABC transporter substrate-binding protein [Polaribacter gangjinensis]|uniref:ABC transporter substrate-binding protein n=1 Tax=Polaribacter gangjinensis TaxID=574710 RepID=UPI001CFF607C|nr:ABC transporter substrate-binding protein [Polaribacter gangjinensis]